LGFKGDCRTYEIAGLILADLGVSSVELLTNNPAKVEAVKEAGIEVQRVQIVPKGWGVTQVRDRDEYLRTKIEKMGHMIDLPGLGSAGVAGRVSSEQKQIVETMKQSERSDTPMDN
jgi:GTP cyclohydrolase II